MERPALDRWHKLALAAGALAILGAVAPWAELDDPQGSTYTVLGSEMVVPGVPGGSATVVSILALGAIALLLAVRRQRLRGVLAALVFGVLLFYAARHLMDTRALVSPSVRCVDIAKVRLGWGLLLLAGASAIGLVASLAGRADRPKPPRAEPDAARSRAHAAGSYHAVPSPALVLDRLPARRRIEERVARGLLLGSASVAAIMLAWLVGRLVMIGAPHIDGSFLECYPNPDPARSGVKAALRGSMWLALLTIVLALPVGVLAGIYLNEYARPSRFTRFLRLVIANLAGVPSIVFGILGLAVFVRAFGLGYVVLAGALTLAVLSLPTIIVATEEALKSVPRSMREAAYGLGATRWQVTKDHVLPYAMPGILTGAILALARALGETAPLILVGGFAITFRVPDGPTSLYSSLPLLNYEWARDPDVDVRALAAAGTVLLLLFILAANAVAIVLRNHYQKKLRW